jgi:predicted MFS family arabinose efflux permease
VRTLWSLLSRERGFRRLLAAALISQVGDWMLAIGVAYYVYQLTGSTLASAGSMLATFLPSILLSSLAGVYVDRWNRKTTMVVTNLVMAVGLLPLLLVHHPRDVWIVYVVAVFEGTVELFFSPAEQAVVPLLVANDDLLTANALNGQAREVARLVGSAIGGVVVGIGGITALAIADAATFLAAALIVSRIRIPTRARPSAAEPRHSRLGALAHEWSQGLRIAWSQPSVRVVFVYTLIAMTGEGVMGTLFAPFVRDVLHGSASAYGLIAGVQAIGGLAGGVVAASLAHRVSAAAMFGFGAVLFGLIDLTMFLYPLVFVALWPAMLCMIMVGIPGAVSRVGYNTVLQRGTEDAVRGRVFGALGAVQGVGIVIGTVAAGVLAEAVGIVPVIAFQGVGGIVAGVVVLIVLRSDVRAPATVPTIRRRGAIGSAPDL